MLHGAFNLWRWRSVPLEGNVAWIHLIGVWNTSAMIGIKCWTDGMAGRAGVEAIENRNHQRK
jgi:hypothetical protein